MLKNLKCNIKCCNKLNISQPHKKIKNNNINIESKLNHLIEDIKQLEILENNNNNNNKIIEINNLTNHIESDINHLIDNIHINNNNKNKIYKYLKLNTIHYNILYIIVIIILLFNSISFIKFIIM
jgi:hypothetical protein